MVFILDIGSDEVDYQELENEVEEEDDVVALRPPQPQMDKKISYNTELPRWPSLKDDHAVGRHKC